jgi:hypothetical protein
MSSFCEKILLGYQRKTALRPHEKPKWLFGQYFVKFIIRPYHIRVLPRSCQYPNDEDLNICLDSGANKLDQVRVSRMECSTSANLPRNIREKNNSWLGVKVRFNSLPAMGAHERPLLN